MGEGQMDGDIESEAGSRLWAVSTEPNEGLKLKDLEIMIWTEVVHLTDWATQGPWLIFKTRFLVWCYHTHVHLWQIIFYMYFASLKRNVNSQATGLAPGAAIFDQ